MVPRIPTGDYRLAHSGFAYARHRRPLVSSGRQRAADVWSRCHRRERPGVARDRLAVANGTDPIFPFFIPRGMAMLLWALSLAIVNRHYARLEFEELVRVGRTLPWPAEASCLPPCLHRGIPSAGRFPPRIDVWDGLADASGTAAVLVLGGSRRADDRGLAPTHSCHRISREAADLPQNPLGAGNAGRRRTCHCHPGLVPRLTGFILSDRLPLIFCSITFPAKRRPRQIKVPRLLHDRWTKPNSIIRSGRGIHGI